MRTHTHNRTGHVVPGTELKPGTELEDGDLCADPGSDWKLCTTPGAVITEDCKIKWVRPEKTVSKGDKLDYHGKKGVVLSVDELQVRVRYLTDELGRSITYTKDAKEGVIPRSKFTYNWVAHMQEWCFR